MFLTFYVDGAPSWAKGRWDLQGLNNWLALHPDWEVRSFQTYSSGVSFNGNDFCDCWEVLVQLEPIALSRRRLNKRKKKLNEFFRRDEILDSEDEEDSEPEPEPKRPTPEQLNWGHHLI